MSVHHIPKPQHPDRFEAWCGARIFGFSLTSLDHAASCVIVGTLVQPCRRCVRGAVAVLTGTKQYVPAKSAPSTDEET